MLEVFIFILIVVFLFFGGLEGIFAFLGGILQGVIWIATAIPVVVGALGVYFIYWITFVA
jgi:hypothetical protein|tara:strand:+ start:166 stop:345 length:180 start_codon:yes stop_codon:yes gene_type:complete